MPETDQLVIRTVTPVTGMYAIYGVPYQASEYQHALPVMALAVLSVGDGDDELVGMVSYGSDIIAADELSPGILVGYYRQGADDPAYIKLLQNAATTAGKALFEQLYPQSRPQPVFQPTNEDGANPSPRRSRRRRRQRPTPQGGEE